MNYFNISLFIGGIVALFSGFIVYRQRPKHLISRTWFALNICSAIWSFGYAIMITTGNKLVAWNSNLILHGAAIFIPIFYLHFILAFTKSTESAKKGLYLSYILGLIFILLNPTKFFIQDVKPKFIFNYAPDAGILYIWFTFYFWLLVLIATIIIIKNILGSRGEISSQLKYILLAEVGFLGGGSVFFLTFNIKFYPYPLILFALYPLVITYAIVRHRLMNVRLVITRSLMFSVLVLTVSGAFTAAALLASRLLNITSTRELIWVNLAIAILVVLFLNPLRNFLARITDKIFFKGAVDYQSVAKHFSDIIATTLERDRLLTHIARDLKERLKLKRVDILFCQDKTKKCKLYYSHSPEEEIGSVSDVMQTHLWNEHSHLIKFFSLYQEIKVREEEERKLENLPQGIYSRKLGKVVRELESRNVAVVIPVLSSKCERAFVFLDDKVSGDIYDGRDIQLLELLQRQLATALEKSRLYDEVLAFNVHLKEEVKRATEELRVANTRLRELDRAKTLFLSVASHQLRTPLTGIKGYISMIVEGDFGEIPQEIKSVIEEVYANTNRLIRLVNTFLNVSRIEAGRLNMIKQEFDAVPMARKIVDELQFSAHDKKLTLTLETAKDSIMLNADQDKIEDVIINFTDNAIKYTQEGSITVRIIDKENTVRFEVQDAGQGLSKDEIASLFHKFSRGPRALTAYTDGSGLGLYIAKRIVDMHQGTLGVESPGVGKGATFWVEMPKKGEDKEEVADQGAK